jgi:hypothetical protein
MAADPMYCDHGRMAASCEACLHADARADARRAPATREELYPFPEGGPVLTGFVPEEARTGGPVEGTTASTGTVTSRRPRASGRRSG